MALSFSLRAKAILPKTMDEVMDPTQEGAVEETPVAPTEGEDMGVEAAPAPETGDEAAA